MKTYVWSSLRNAVVVLLIAFAPAAIPFASAASDDLVVATDDGPVRGVATSTMRKFLGIPYAAAPVGELRWQPPQPHERWTAVRDATQFGNHCPQVASPFGLASTNEDCLFLNVYTPLGANPSESQRRPVMVWVHGGALVVGESDDYDPARLVAQNIVVVTINYRLGILGYLAHPAMTAESDNDASGNYGFMDQQFALDWVRRNIGRFGGDANNVTLFGESAGGLSVHTQLASPLARGLFEHAIVESGAYQLTQPTLAAAETLGRDLATRVGCSDQTAECLRAVPVAALLADVAAGAIASPVVDNHVLTQSIGTAFARGDFNQVPVIEGSNRDEWRLFVALNNELPNGPVTAEQYAAAIAATLRLPSAAAAAPIVAQYPLANYPSPGIALGAVGTDAIFACPARAAVRGLSQHVNTFAYEFADQNAPQLFLPPVSFPYGAYHSAELQYLFNLRATVPAPSLNAEQQSLSQHMVRYWTQFARTGDPNVSDSPQWPRYESGTDTFLKLIPPTPTTETDFASIHMCAFWTPA
ncbi:MAG: carboxylesterase/lipase family protein [Sulfurifustaceae bacterium]